MTTTSIVIPEDFHTVIEFRQNDLPGFATVNTALAEFEPKIVFSWHLSLLLQCVDLIKNRLPSPDEQKVLYAFEEKLDPLKPTAMPCSFLGSHMMASEN